LIFVFQNKYLKEEVKIILDDEKIRLNKQYYQAIKEAKEAIKAKNTKEAHQKLNLAHKNYQKIKQTKEISSSSFKEGDSVKFLTTTCIIIKIKNKEAILECNGKRVTALLHSLSHAPKIPQPKTTKLTIQKPKSANIKLDLHGLRAQEALDKLDKFINNALLAGFDEVLIYHGIGSGILSRVVREYLKENPLVISFEDAPINLGGYGATIAKF